MSEEERVEGDKYKDIEGNYDSGRCAMCSCKLKCGDSPWSICFDPEWRHNCWGGDSHQYRGRLCQACAEELLTNE